MNFLWLINILLSIKLGAIKAIAWVIGYRKGAKAAEEANKLETERVLHEETVQRNIIDRNNSSTTALDELRKDGWTGH